MTSRLSSRHAELRLTAKGLLVLIQDSLWYRAVHVPSYETGRATGAKGSEEEDLVGCRAREGFDGWWAWK